VVPFTKMSNIRKQYQFGIEDMSLGLSYVYSSWTETEAARSRDMFGLENIVLGSNPHGGN
jgi:hypothetical protein